MSIRIVFTGPPGSGKTTLLDALADSGHRVMAEGARALIRARLDAGLSPRPEPRRFAGTLLEQDLEKWQQADEFTEPTFFDRGLLDSVAFARSVGVDEGRVQRAETTLAAKPPARVFLFPPWAQIYRTDSERDQTFTEAVRTHAKLQRWLAASPFTVVQVPKTTVEARAAWVAEELVALRGR